MTRLNLLAALLAAGIAACSSAPEGIAPDSTPVVRQPTSEALETLSPAPTQPPATATAAAAESATPTLVVATVQAAAAATTPATATPTGTPTATVAPTSAEGTELPGVYLGLWLSTEELARLPMAGAAWEQLLAAAEGEVGVPDLSDQDSNANVLALAKALVYARTGEQRYRDDVLAALRALVLNESEQGGRTLALGRELAAYIIAADLINLPAADPELHSQFSRRITQLLVVELEGRTLQSTHETRPNNWGTHAGASRAAIALYTGNQEELEKTAQVFKGWLGDREAYSGFEYGGRSWQCEFFRPVAINPKGCEKDGRSIDGALPEEMRRGGGFTWPPEETGYAWEALQGALVQAQLLYRAGYDTWEWQDRALLRAVEFLHGLGWEADGDDQWQPWLVNYAYAADFETQLPARPGKNMGWTDWTHASPPPEA